MGKPVMTTPAVTPVRDTRAPGPLTAVSALALGSASGGLVALAVALIAEGFGTALTWEIPTVFVVAWAASTWAFARRAPSFWAVFARAGVTGAAEWTLVSLLGVVVPVGDAAARTVEFSPPPITWVFVHGLMPMIHGVGPLFAALLSLFVGIVGALAGRALLLRA